MALTENINFLNHSVASLSIAKLPNVSYFCQRVNLPGISLTPVEMNTPWVNIPFAGDRPTYEPLTVVFLVDENLVNWKEIRLWMIKLGFDRSGEQYAELVNEGIYSDATLILSTNKNNYNEKIIFERLVPTNLSAIEFDTTANSTDYVTATATFTYEKYSFADDTKYI